MRGVTALLDANVLFSACLRDFLLRLASELLYRPLWSDRIQREWTSHLLERRKDLSRERLERTHREMRTHFPDARITGYEHLTPAILLPDPDDRHVLAAAIHGGADVIVTGNLKDFPSRCTLSYGIRAQSPDDFIMDLVDAAPSTVAKAARLQRLALQNPPRSAKEHLVAYRGAGLRRVAARLRHRITDL